MALELAKGHKDAGSESLYRLVKRMDLDYFLGLRKFLGGFGIGKRSAER